MDDFLDKAKNHLVVLGVTVPGSGRQSICREVNLFCKYDIATIVKAIFVKLNMDEFDGLEKYLPAPASR